EAKEAGLGKNPRRAGGREGRFFRIRPFPPTTKRQQDKRVRGWDWLSLTCRLSLAGGGTLARQGKQRLQRKTAASARPSSSAGAAPSLHDLLELWCAWKEYVKTIKQRLACNKKAIIGIVISHLIFGIFLFFLGTSVPLNCQKEAIKCPSVTCPSDWIGHQRHCYNLSRDEKNWNESQKFCMLHNASLAKITKEEMDFVTNLTRNYIFWIGLKREPDQPWKWLDGENAMLKVRGDGGDCAYLVDDATASSGRCTTEHRYICKKNDFMRS
ncbi:C-type lectin domain family 2 member D11-like, partial [Ahaetulla prasina]|uniref:C-type lectin domain family 2 member D11-like n=1 Tax=Ahaetulla prasina TaxID=499056 RepID=UPI002649992B